MEKKHNLLISIVKLIFSIVILYRHCYIPFIDYPIFPGDTCASYCFDMFFIIIGFYLFKNIKTFLSANEGSLFHLIKEYTYRRLKKLSPALIVAVAATIIDIILERPFVISPHFLWFLLITIIFEAITIFLLYHYDDRITNIVFLIFYGVATIIRVMFFDSGVIPDEVDCFILIPLGHFISYLKRYFKNTKYNIIIVVFLLAQYLISSVFVYRAIFSYIAFCYIIFPLIVLFSISSKTDTASKINYYISKISLYIYLYQCIGRAVLTIMSRMSIEEPDVMIAFIATASLTIIDIVIEKVMQKEKVASYATQE